jgi:hypothetical protein
LKKVQLHKKEFRLNTKCRKCRAKILVKIMPRKNHPPRKKSSSFVKGKLVENVVATLYNGENIQVEKNARFPAVDDSTRKREIDVLITHLDNSSNKHTIIECKNYKKIIDAPLIDAFVGKLDDIGVPTQSGVFVSVVKYPFYVPKINRQNQAF